MKQTKGPWEIGDDRIVRKANTVNTAIAEVFSPKSMAKGEAMANAKLIAAAPLLLEALQEFIEIAHGGDGSYHASPAKLMEASKKAREAIKQATE